MRPRQAKRQGPLLVPAGTCPECGQGHGYDVFLSDGKGHAPAELQRNDGCQCLSSRFHGEPAHDGEAALAFVRDLENGDSYAIRCALSLIAGPRCWLPPGSVQPDPLRELVSAARELDPPLGARFLEALELFDGLEV